MKQKQQPNWILKIALLVMLSLLFVGCGPKEADSLTVGVINLAPVLEPVFESFKTQMTELGYVEGENITYIYDGAAGSIADLDNIAQDLIEADVDLILSLSTPATQVMLDATDEIPIIFAPINDPIDSGLVDNLIQPGGNGTGVMYAAQEEKRFDLFLQVTPDVKRIYIPYNPQDASALATLKKVTALAPQFDVEIVEAPAQDNDQITAVLENIPDDVDAIYLFPESLLMNRAADVAAKALELGLPSSVPDDHPVISGGILMSYGFRFDEVGKQAARLADQVLKNNISPGDLPVESADFFLVINLKTAEAIGIEIPDVILRQADTIIRE